MLCPCFVISRTSLSHIHQFTIKMFFEIGYFRYQLTSSAKVLPAFPFYRMLPPFLELTKTALFGTEAAIIEITEDSFINEMCRALLKWH